MKKLIKVAFLESVQTSVGFQEVLGEKYKVKSMEFTQGGVFFEDENKETKELKKVFVPHANVRFCVFDSNEKE